MYSHQCPRCCKNIYEGETTGQSSIYGSSDIPDLCESCFFAEENEIDIRNMNDLPDTLAVYRYNIRNPL